MSDGAAREAEEASLAMKSNDSDESEAPKEKRAKVPRRVLHFSDGVLEEYSTDEEETEEQVDAMKAQKQVMDPRMLPWMPWFWYYASTFADKTLKACDFVGEPLANFLGITSSKYQYEVAEYERMKAQEEAEKKKRDLEMAGWTSGEGNDEVGEQSLKGDGDRVMEQPQSIAATQEHSEHM